MLLENPRRLGIIDRFLLIAFYKFKSRQAPERFYRTARNTVVVIILKHRGYNKAQIARKIGRSSTRVNTMLGHYFYWKKYHARLALERVFDSSRWSDDRQIIATPNDSIFYLYINKAGQLIKSKDKPDRSKNRYTHPKNREIFFIGKTQIEPTVLINIS